MPSATASSGVSALFIEPAQCVEIAPTAAVRSASPAIAPTIRHSEPQHWSAAARPVASKPPALSSARSSLMYVVLKGFSFQPAPCHRSVTLYASRMQRSHGSTYSTTFVRVKRLFPSATLGSPTKAGAAHCSECAAMPGTRVLASRRKVPS